MDFSNRDVQPHAGGAGTHPPVASQNQGPVNTKQAKHEGEKGDLIRVITVILVAALVILLCAVIALINSDNNQTKAAAQNTQAGLVKTDKLQAVFLNNGQVYFGKIKTLNSKYFVVTNVYGVQTTSSNASDPNAKTNVTLVKLGCEQLHDPYDQLIINADTVTFWENLQDNGQVAKTIAAFQKQNPNGEKCIEQGTNSSSNSNTSTTTPLTTH